ncbi:hypothetical protein J4558_27905 [Leptolyngbya sp. 15MV]|nr:hypothetical protein J4558_27905 [Leptolyngbya sp. 15MV]
MSDSYRALCSDFYLNQKLNLKLELPRDRQPMLDLFDRFRRQFPGMTQFRRLKEEIALEAEPGPEPHRWVAVRSSSIRSGSVNYPSLDEALALHRHVLEVSPFFLGVSPLDVDFLELLFGFDVVTDRPHDDAVAAALMGNGPMADLLNLPDSVVVDFQPMLGLLLRDGLGPAIEGCPNRDLEVSCEVKTRPGPRTAAREEPISVYLTLRHYGPLRDITQLPMVLDRLAQRGEEIALSSVMPQVVVPIRQALGMES